jgi:GT2 family glycosyltransferase
MLLFAFIDDDDEWKSNKLKKQIEAFELGVGLVSCRNIKNNKNVEFSYKELLISYKLGRTSSFLIRREVFDIVGFFDEKLPAAQDHEMGLRIAKRYRVIVVPEELVIYNEPERHIGINFEKRIKGHIILYKKYSHDYIHLGFKNAIIQHIKIIVWIFILSFGLINKEKTTYFIVKLQKKLHTIKSK